MLIFFRVHQDINALFMTIHTASLLRASANDHTYPYRQTDITRF